MARKDWDWSATGWPRVVLGTIFGTLGCSAVALYVDSFNFATKTPDELLNAYLVDILAAALPCRPAALLSSPASCASSRSPTPR